MATVTAPSQTEIAMATNDYDGDIPSSDEEADVASGSPQHDASLVASMSDLISGGKTLRFSQTDTFPARDVQVSIGEKVQYFGKTSQYTPGRPDLVFRADGFVVAHVFFRWAGSIKCGVGGGDETTMHWVEMKRESLTGMHKAFGFEWRGHKYTLTRTREEGHGVVGSKKWLMGHYKVIEANGGGLVAVYISDEPLGRRTGTLRLKEGVEPELEVLIVAGIAAWREKVRRRQRMGGRMVF